jgi:hypothetical protein
LGQTLLASATMMPIKIKGKSMFDLWQFGLDVHQVMTARILRMMTGELTAHEARRMIAEKQTAYSHAQISGAYALLSGGPAVAGHE